MLSFFEANINVAVEVSTVWDIVSNSRFVKDFLPEIRKNATGLSSAYLTTHKNRLNTLPSYVIPLKTIHWNRNSNTVIQLAKNDLNVVINHVEINLEAKKNGVIISIEVEYDNPITSKYLFTNKVIKSLFSKKLAVLKQDLKMLEPLKVSPLNSKLKLANN